MSTRLGNQLDAAFAAFRMRKKATGQILSAPITGPNGARDEFRLAAAAKDLRKLAKLIPMPSQPAPA